MSRTAPQAPRGLPRGQACIHCRRRKMRCDGVRPVCGSCMRVNRPEDCQYTDEGRSRIEYLEDTIATVEARIKELEQPRSGIAIGQPVLLHQPYMPTNDEWWQTLDPPIATRTIIINKFLPFAADVGFSMNPTRFRARVLLSDDDAESHLRPIPALLSAAYLWGIHWSNSDTLKAHTEVYLDRALSSLSTALPSQADQIMQTLQAHFLVGYYLLSAGRLLEGKYHISAALSIGMGGGLNKIRTTNPEEVPGTALAPPVDSIEEGERVDMLWMALFIDRTWAVFLKTVPDLNPNPMAEYRTDTPWPLEDEGYENGGFHPDFRSRHTIRRFLEGHPDPAVNEFNTKALLTKSAILWERAYHFWNGDLTTEQHGEYLTFEALDRLLESLRRSLIPPNQLVNRTPAKLRRLFVSHSLTYMGILQLHSGLARRNAQSGQKTLLAATTIFRMVTTTRLGTMAEFINPIMGTVWVTAGSFLFEELARLKSLRLRPGEMTDSERTLKVLVDDALNNMQPLARSSILMSSQLQQLQDAYHAVLSN